MSASDAVNANEKMSYKLYDSGPSARPSSQSAGMCKLANKS
jgi:hypothetical protein